MYIINANKYTIKISKTLINDIKYDKMGLMSW